MPIEQFEAVMNRKDLSWDDKYRILWRAQYVPVLDPEKTIRAHLAWMKSKS